MILRRGKVVIHRFKFPLIFVCSQNRGNSGVDGRDERVRKRRKGTCYAVLVGCVDPSTLHKDRRRDQSHNRSTYMHDSTKATKGRLKSTIEKS